MTDAALATPEPAAPERLGVISWESGPRKLVMIYLPLACFVVILLFPFYWMAITSFKPNAELLNYKAHNPGFLDLLADAGPCQTSAVRYRLSALADDDDGIGGDRRPPSSRCSRVRSRPTRSNACASAAVPMVGSASISPIWYRRRSCSFRWRRWWCSSGCSTVRWR